MKCERVGCELVVLVTRCPIETTLAWASSSRIASGAIGQTYIGGRGDDTCGEGTTSEWKWNARNRMHHAYINITAIISDTD